MLRKLALSLAVSAALGVSQAHALGLGEIQVNSALNEPLDAEIKLTQVRDLSPLQIQPRLAALDEYSRFGNASQARYLRDIQFQVLLDPDGEGRIRLRSNEPIQEPFLNFMVEVNWPSGRLVREYTLLLDPPVFDPAPVRRTLQPAQVAATAESRPAPAPEPVAAQSLRPAGPVSNIRTRMDSETQVYVSTDDTLWEIASRHKPEGISEHQMMLALLAKNPSAFPSGNINAMRAGVVMDLPSAEEAGRVSQREAVAEVARQMQLWREGKVSQQSDETRAPVDVSRQNDEEASAEKETTASDSQESTAAEEQPSVEEGQLKIVAPQEDAAEQAETAEETGETVTSEEAETSAGEEDRVSNAQDNLEDDVLIAQERIDRLERENADLNDKLSSVLEQLEAQSRLLELQSQQMATLQSELAENASRAAEPREQSSDAGLLQTPSLLAGIGAGALAALAAVWLLMRRKKADEGDKKPELVSVPDELRETEDEKPEPTIATGAAAAAGAAAVTAAAAATPDQDETGADSVARSQEPADQSDESAPNLDEDLKGLDLDMDLSTTDEGEAAGEQHLDAAEFDLSTETEDEPAPTLAPLSASSATDDAGDLDFRIEPEEEKDEKDSAHAEEADALDFMLDQDSESDSDEALIRDALKEEPEFSLADDAVDATDTGADRGRLSDSLEMEEDQPLHDNGLSETVEPVSTEDIEIDENLEAMLQGATGEDIQTELSDSDDSADASLDDLLSSLDLEDEQTTAGPAATAEQVEDELTANISHDLEMDVDAEVDELLGSTDDEIELDELRNDEGAEIIDKMELLKEADEAETKLDLARAYMDMDDKPNARDVLNEVISEGTEEQRREAQKMLDSLN